MKNNLSTRCTGQELYESRKSARDQTSRKRVVSNHMSPIKQRERECLKGHDFSMKEIAHNCKIISNSSYTSK